MKTEDFVKKYKEFVLEVEEVNKQDGYAIRFPVCRPTFENFMFYLEHEYIKPQKDE